MSPASSLDALEVERYVGACLFSQNRSKNGFVGPSPERWAGGAPLISFAGYHRPNRRQSREEANHLAQLAVHTHGAPLILTKYYHHRRNKGPKAGGNNVVQQTKVFENTGGRKQSTKGVDSVSVTSDESSGSQNSETCLPRIIKPRKRRKKDRKPTAHHGRPQVFNDLNPYYPQDTILTNLPPYFPYLEPFQPSQDVSDFRDSSLDFLDASETPKLHHSFEEVEEGEDANQPASTCQCRYCDPEGQIWDVDRSCYSPFLTPPKSFDFSSLFPSSLSQPSIFDNLQSQLAGLSLGEDKPPFSRSTSSSSTSSFSSTGDLEVSTEIVTSPNGHRDLEIKFWLSGGGNAEPKSTNGRADNKPG